MATKAAFIYIAPANGYKVHKAFIDSPVVNLTVVGVKTYDEAEVVTRELVAGGITAMRGKVLTTPCDYFEYIDK